VWVFPAPATSQDDQSAYDRIWNAVNWYQNDGNPIVQSMVLTGRFQADYARVGDVGTSYDEWNVRRFRFGAKWALFRTLTLQVEADFNPQERDPFYKRLTDVKLEWAPNENVEFAIGKQSVPFTLDGATSSKELLTIDRSNLATNMWFPQEYMPGLSLAGGNSGWNYHVGAYSAGEANREFGEFNGAIFTLISVGYDLSEQLGKETDLRADYIYQSEDPQNSFTRSLEHVASLSFRLTDGLWGFSADMTTGIGYGGQSDLRGLQLLPFLDLTEQLQLVGRFTHVESDDPNGVRLGRYENQAISGLGDRYREFYTGVNYYVYGHKLKLQSGLAFGDMNDTALDGGKYSGTSWVTGVRISW
jgi:phosphate-selective porin OprO/OprP